jgi:hypothetical protein
MTTFNSLTHFPVDRDADMHAHSYQLAAIRQLRRLEAQSWQRRSRRASE